MATSPRSLRDVRIRFPPQLPGPRGPAGFNGAPSVPYQASQIATSRPVYPTTRLDPDRWAGRKAIAGQDFGVPADASADALPAIMAIAAALDARGGGVLQLPPTSLVIGGTLDNRFNRVLIEGGGHGEDWLHDAGAPTFGTVLVPAFAGTALKHRTPYGSASTPANAGGGFRHLRVIGNSIATRLLEVDSVIGGTYRLTAEEAVGTDTAVLFKSGAQGVDLGDTPCVQNIDCHLYVRQASNGNVSCVRMSGTATGNPSINRGVVLDLVHKNGHALVLENADNNHFWQRSYRIGGGSGYAVWSKASNGLGQNARANVWDFLSCNGDIVFQGTESGTYPSNRNRIIRLDSENGTPAPILGAGAGCQVDGMVNTFVSTVGATSGAIAAATASGEWSYAGGHVVGIVSIVVTSNGTGAGALTFTLPIPKDGGAVDGVCHGKELVLTGKAVAGIVNGTTGAIQYADGLYPGASGAVLRVEFRYRPY